MGCCREVLWAVRVTGGRREKLIEIDANIFGGASQCLAFGPFLKGTECESSSLGSGDGGHGPCTPAELED